MNAAPPPTHHTLAHTSSTHTISRHSKDSAMSAVESSPPSAPNTTHPTKPATPTLVSVAGWVLLAIAVGWLVHGCHVCDDAAVAFFDLARPVAGGGAGVLSGDVFAGQRLR